MEFKTITIEEMITELQKEKTFADTVFFDGLSAPSRLQNQILRDVYKVVNMQCFKGELPNLQEITVSFKGAPPNALGCAFGGHIISISTEHLVTFAGIVNIMFHEAAHIFNQINGVEDVSHNKTRNQYHNRNFKKVIVEHGGICNYSSRLGFSDSSLNEKDMKIILDHIERKVEKMGMKRICPICNNTYYEPPAISRKDNKTEICPDCGTLEALESIGASDEMKAEVLAKIHEARKGAGV